MFEFLKKSHNQSPIEQLESHLRHLGYELNDNGRNVAEERLAAGEAVLDLAIRMAYTTMAFDLSQTGAAATALLRFRPQAADMLKVLEEYREHGMLDEAKWQQAQALIIAISAINEQQEATLKQVLSDPELGKERLARSVKM